MSIMSEAKKARRRKRKERKRKRALTTAVNAADVMSDVTDVQHLNDVHEDLSRPAARNLYKESLTLGPGNCHQAVSLVMNGLMLDADWTGIKPKADWHMALGLRPLEQGVGLHSWLEPSKFAVVEVAWHEVFRPLIAMGRVEDYYKVSEIELLLRVSLHEWDSLLSFWPPTEEDIAALNTVRRSPIEERCRQAILTERERGRLVLTPGYAAINEKLGGVLLPTGSDDAARTEGTDK